MSKSFSIWEKMGHSTLSTILQRYVPRERVDHITDAKYVPSEHKIVLFVSCSLDAVDRTQTKFRNPCTNGFPVGPLDFQLTLQEWKEIAEENGGNLKGFYEDEVPPLSVEIGYYIYQPDWHILKIFQKDEIFFA